MPLSMVYILFWLTEMGLAGADAKVVQVPMPVLARVLQPGRQTSGEQKSESSGHVERSFEMRSHRSEKS